MFTSIGYVSELTLASQQSGDVGINLPASQRCVIPPFKKMLVMSDICFELPSNTWGIILPRSSSNSLGLDIPKSLADYESKPGALGIMVLPGVIDPSYIGRLGTFIMNLDCEGEFVIEAGQSVSQLVVVPAVTPYRFVKMKKLSPTQRGVNGFGSTGHTTNQPG